MFDYLLSVGVLGMKSCGCLENIIYGKHKEILWPPVGEGRLQRNCQLLTEIGPDENRLIGYWSVKVVGDLKVSGCFSLSQISYRMHILRVFLELAVIQQSNQGCDVHQVWGIRNSFLILRTCLYYGTFMATTLLITSPINISLCSCLI